MASLVSSFKRCALSSRHTSTAAILTPFLQTQYRSASILSSLSDVPAAYNKRIRRGRGPSSGKGKTSGRGHKGQKQHGKVPTGFNGGQTPDEVVHGIRGEDNQHTLDLAVINVDRIQHWIDSGRIDPTKPITLKELHESRCTHGIRDGVKLLARNATELRVPIHITVSRASAQAISAIEALGGTVQTRYYTRSSIRRVLRGETHPTLSRLSIQPAPASTSTTPGALPATNPGAPIDILDPVRTSTDPSMRASTALNIGLSGGLGNKPMQAYKYRLPDPASRKDIEYYRDERHRGYLSHLVGEGESPSLFFKTPQQMRKILGRQGSGKKAAAGTEQVSRLW